MKIGKYARIRERYAVTQREGEQIAADHPPQRRKESETKRLLGILDELSAEEQRSQAFEETAAREDYSR